MIEGFAFGAAIIVYIVIVLYAIWLAFRFVYAHESSARAQHKIADSLHEIARSLATSPERPHPPREDKR